MDARPTCGYKRVSEWLTYAVAASRFGVSPEAVRQIAMRRKWPRRRPNDNPFGPVQVLIPSDAAIKPRTPVGQWFVAPAVLRVGDAHAHGGVWRPGLIVQWTVQNALREAKIAPEALMLASEAPEQAIRGCADTAPSGSPRRVGMAIADDIGPSPRPWPAASAMTSQPPEASRRFFALDLGEADIASLAEPSA